MAEAKDEFRLFKRSYKDSDTGEMRQLSCWYVQFRDHHNIRQRWPAFNSERQSRKLADRIMEMVGARRSGEPLTVKQNQFLEGAADDLRRRLIESDIIDRRHGLRGGPLLPLLEGERDEKGKITTAGYRQALEAKGNSAGHVALTIQRAKRIIEACAFVTVADLRRPGAVTEIQVFLGGLRDKGELNGAGYNAYVRCLGAFCRWMVEDGRLPNNPLAKLKKVSNTDVDRDLRRELTVEEMRRLLDITLKQGKEKFGLSATERERLYRFAYQTGMRPGQIRGLTKASFNLDADPPIVTAAAATVKRRKAHTQVLTPEMATELREAFKTMVPAASAFKMPSKYNLARMLQADLADARGAWIASAGDDVKEQMKRQQSDFLADVDHDGGRADFYSLRHAHGTALADAGVPQKDVQASMHHANGKTTERYMHTRQKSLAVAVGKLPQVKPIAQAAIVLATGTDGRAKMMGPAMEPTPQPLTTFGDSKAIRGNAGDLAICSENRDPASPDGKEHVAQLVEQRTFNPLSQSKNPRKNSGETVSGNAIGPAMGPNSTPAPPEVAEIAAAWPALPEPIKAGILAMVRASAPNKPA